MAATGIERLSHPIVQLPVTLAGALGLVHLDAVVLHQQEVTHERLEVQPTQHHRLHLVAAWGVEGKGQLLLWLWLW